MRIFKTKWFARYARKAGIDDESLRDAIERAEKGLIDGDLKDELIKQRVARDGEGKRGGFRTIVAYREGDRSVFVFGFAKNDRGNISKNELKDLKKLGALYLSFTDKQMQAALDQEELFEVSDDDEEAKESVSE